MHIYKHAKIFIKECGYSPNSRSFNMFSRYKNPFLIHSSAKVLHMTDTNNTKRRWKKCKSYATFKIVHRRNSSDQKLKPARNGENSKKILFHSETLQFFSYRLVF